MTINILQHDEILRSAQDDTVLYIQGGGGKQGRFVLIFSHYTNYDTKRPCFPPPKPDPTKKCHPERSEGSPSLFSNFIMKFLEYK